ncbi:MAG: VanZ family protein, partial [Huintestinicola sp.]
TAYLFLVFSSTIFCRTVGQEYQYKLELFWSYRVAAAGNSSMICEIILNCLMLLPVGFLFPTAVKKDMKLVLLTVFAVSVSIELSQLVLKRGLFEFDDIIHNTISGALGYGLFLLWERIQKEYAQKVSEKSAF